MGKLLIIPRSDTTRDNARVNSKGEEQERTTATAAIVVGSSATNGAIADSAAADRDRRFLIASILDNGLSRGCEDESRPISGIVDATRRTTIGNVRSDLVARNNALDRWNARIAVDDGRTCCFSSLDVASFFPRRRARDRAISCDHFTCGRSSLIERRNRRRAVSSSLTRSRSVTAPVEVAEVEKSPRSTVGDVAIGREARNRFSVPYVDSTDRVSKCDGCTLSDSSVLNNVSGSPRTVLETRESIDVNDTGNVWANNNICNPAGLIGLVKSSCIFPEEIVNRRNTSSSSRFPARIDRNGQTWPIKTYWRMPRIGLVLRGLLLGLLVMSLLCDIVLAAPSSSSSLATLEAIDTFEDGIEEEELVPRNKLGNDELEIIKRSIMQGLGLQRIPDPSKANVSQAEYERAHREYLKQVQLSHDGQESRRRRDLHVFQTTEHPGNRSSVNWRGGNHHHFLYFPVAVSDTEDVTVDHAALRFLLQGDYRRPRDLEVLVYFCTPISRRLLLRRKISQIQSTDSRWLELDFTEAAADWLERNLDNHGLELEFLHDGQPTRRDISYTTLNVFTTFESGSRRKRSTPEEIMSLHKGRRSKCKGNNNKKCCRHELTVMFKDLEGFDFIVFPKGFDAGYCKGRCPPRYNPAHHHALLQSLLWKEDRKRVPKPCCAPSKLDELKIVYYDENNTTRLSMSQWKSIQVLECACS
ncbi:TGF-beta family profile domain-containing protein [Camponotus japonicus]